MEHAEVDLDYLRSVRKPRPLPRPFSFHWGGGNVVEEATALNQFVEPTIQLMEFEDGSLTVRFCSYSHRGGFQRNPLMLSEADIPELRESIQRNPRLLALLKQLVD